MSAWNIFCFIRPWEYGETSIRTVYVTKKKNTVKIARAKFWNEMIRYIGRYLTSVYFQVSEVIWSFYFVKEWLYSRHRPFLKKLRHERYENDGDDEKTAVKVHVSSLKETQEKIVSELWVQSGVFTMSSALCL